MEAYSYVSSGGMIILLLILGAIITYLFFSKGFWLDRFMCSKWEGQDIEPDYNTNQKQSIHDAISQEKVPFTPSLDIPFEDPEVPNRPSKKKVKKPKTKRVYKRRKKK
jgi:hypothetical protein